MAIFHHVRKQQDTLFLTLNCVPHTSGTQAHLPDSANRLTNPLHATIARLATHADHPHWIDSATQVIKIATFAEPGVDQGIQCASSPPPMTTAVARRQRRQ